MIRYLTLNQVLVQQRMVINGTGGKHGFKDIRAWTQRWHSRR